MFLSRRYFLVLTAGAFLQPAAAGGKREMLVRSARPEDLEMPLSGFSDYITPIDRFFVRSHVYTPRIDDQPVATDGRGRRDEHAHIDHGRSAAAAVG